MLATDRRFVSILGFRPTGDLGPLTFYTAKNGKIVVFPRAPPLQPPSQRQRHQRNLFRHAAAVWQTLPGSRRAQWTALARDNYLRITGYNLFVYYQLKHDAAAIRTLKPSWGPPY